MSEEENPQEIPTEQPPDAVSEENSTSEVVVKFDDAVLQKMEEQERRIKELEAERDEVKKNALLNAIKQAGIDTESIKNMSIEQLEAINSTVAKNPAIQFIDEKKAEPRKQKIIGFRDPVTNEWIDEIEI